MRRYICGKCGKELASPQSLWNHKQRCDGGVGVKRPASSYEDISVFDGSEFGTG